MSFHGTAQWATPSEVGEASLLSNAGMPAAATGLPPPSDPPQATSKSPSFGGPIVKVILALSAAVIAYRIWSSWIAPRLAPAPPPVVTPSARSSDVGVAPQIPNTSGPAIATTPPAHVPAPQPVKKVRAPLPDRTMVKGMTAGASTRDYFLQLMRDNANLCAEGKGAYELKMMQRLTEWAEASRTGIMEAAKMKEYQARLAPYSARIGKWSRRDREDVFKLIQDILRENGSPWFGGQVDNAWNSFYEKGACPFDTVSAADYQPPMYGSGDKLTLFP